MVEAKIVKLACNIDRRGQKARSIGGSIVVLCGIALILVGTLMNSRRTLIAGVFFCVIGSFMIFEGARGWCALRAMGIKTPL